MDASVLMTAMDSGTGNFVFINTTGLNFVIDNDTGQVRVWGSAEVDALVNQNFLE